MISRRKLFGLLAAGAVVAPELLASLNRTIFLPPRGGWPHGRLAALIIPPDHAWMWDAEIADGSVEYDSATETMTLLKRTAPAVITSHEWASIPMVTPRGMFLVPEGGGIRKPNESLKREYEISRGIPPPPSPPKMPGPIDDPVSRARAAARTKEILGLV